MKFNVKNKKTLAFLLVGVFALAMASGALVNYLSNSVDADVEVDSPLELKINDQKTGWNSAGTSVDLGKTYGGSTVTYYIQEENLANNEITSELKTTISNTMGIEDCSEIENVVVSRDGTTVATLGNSITCAKTGGNLVLTMD